MKRKIELFSKNIWSKKKIPAVVLSFQVKNNKNSMKNYISMKLNENLNNLNKNSSNAINSYSQIPNLSRFSNKVVVNESKDDLKVSKL